MSDEYEYDEMDRLLHEAFVSRPHAGGSPSLVDVRHRARRHQRRRVGGALGATAVLGVSGVAVLAARGGPETGIAGDDASSTTPMSVDEACMRFAPPTTVEYFEAPTTTITWMGTTLPSEATSTTVQDSTSPSGCVPTGQFRCIGNNGTDEKGYTLFEWCEPTTAYPTTTMSYFVPSSTVEGTAAEPATTVIDPSGLMVVDASGGLPGASADMISRLSESGVGTIRSVTATHAVEQTTLMPIGESAGLEIVRQLSGIDGYDTWTPDLIDGPLWDGTLAVIVIGQDYWDRNGVPVTTVAP